MIQNRFNFRKKIFPRFQVIIYFNFFFSRKRNFWHHQVFSGSIDLLFPIITLPPFRNGRRKHGETICNVNHPSLSEWGRMQNMWFCRFQPHQFFCGFAVSSGLGNWLFFLKANYLNRKDQNRKKEECRNWSIVTCSVWFVCVFFFFFSSSSNNNSKREKGLLLGNQAWRHWRLLAIRFGRLKVSQSFLPILATCI